jgi:uncharacterized protein
MLSEVSISALSIERPRYLFGRHQEWAALVDFVQAPGRGARLGLVYGRRRQGKTLLLEALCEATHGFMWQALQQSSLQNLRDLSDALGRFNGVAPRLESWDEAIAVLLDLRRADGGGAPLPIVLDEIGYVLDADAGFASRLQAALSPGAVRRRGRANRLILCGSAFGQMRSLIDAEAPLRGRAQLDLVIRPFRFREAAAYWRLESNPDLAFQLHALVGGTPAYREFVGGHGPKRGDLDAWVAARLLSPSSPMFREGRVSVAEDPSLSDRSLYWAVLGAIADGARARGEITKALGRPPTSLHHALNALTGAGWLGVEKDPLRTRSTRFVIDEPMVRFHRLVIEPSESRLSRAGKAPEVWDQALPGVRSRIYGPHLEQLAREWLLLDAAEEVTGARVRAVGPSLVGAGGAKLQLDLLAISESTRGKSQVCCVGEVKSGEQRTGPTELARLDHAVTLLPSDRVAAQTKRILVSRAGFTRELETQARRRADVELVDLRRLYAE